MKITAIEPFVCDGGLREFGFVKVSTDEGVAGWPETYDWHTWGALIVRPTRETRQTQAFGPRTRSAALVLEEAPVGPEFRGVASLAR